MKITTDKIVAIPDQMKNGKICVDFYDNQLIKGRIHYCGQNEHSFENLMQLLFQIENALNTVNFPDCYTEVRGFSKIPKNLQQQNTNEKTKEEILTGKLATFAIKILFRQNASWQGVLTWIEGGKEVSFRSVFEMIVLMNSALEK